MEKMMRDTIANALKDALKARDACRVSTLRLIQATLKDRDIANRGAGKGPVEDDELLQILAKMIKQREESAKIYDEGGRPELAAKEREEIAIISEFMPKQLSEAEVIEIIKGIIAEIGAASMKDMGKVMKEVNARIAGRADARTVSEKVRERLLRP